MGTYLLEARHYSKHFIPAISSEGGFVPWEKIDMSEDIFLF